MDPMGLIEACAIPKIHCLVDKDPHEYICSKSIELLRDRMSW